MAFAFLLWLVAFACFRAPGFATGLAGPRETFYLAITSAIGFALSGVLYLAATWDVRGLGRAGRVVLVLGVVIVLVLAHAAADLALLIHYMRIKIVLTPMARVGGYEYLLLNNVLTLAPAYLTYAAGIGLGLSLRAIHEREQRLVAALAAAQEARLAALRFQINPHFLFNSLNAVVSLAASGRNQDVQAIVTRLAEFFRATLSREPDAMVTLEEEIDVLSAYLDIESARFGPRLKVRIDLPEALAQASVPHFLLQPLVENAVKHGVAPSLRPVTLSVAATAADDDLVITVSDDGAGGAPEGAGTGVGLKNVAARLQAHYGSTAALAAERLAQGFRVELRVPLLFAEADA